MESIAAWAAPAATMTAAVIVASNLGARITGWGFVVYTVGAICWLVVAVSTGQQNLLLTNAFLLLVNLLGIWRWLGRQARFEDGGQAAARASARRAAPSLVPASALTGSSVKGADGETLGSVIDLMLRADRRDIAYLVVSDGKAGGLGETLRALPAEGLRFGEGEVAAPLSKQAFERLPPIPADSWPAEAPAAPPVSAPAPAR